MNAARLIIVGVLVQSLLLAAALAGSYALSLHIISERDQVWCPVLHLSLSAPVPRHATAAQRAGRADVIALARQFGC